MNTETTAAGTAALTTITNGTTACDCCGRRITRQYIVTYPFGQTAALGRKCAAIATGWDPKSLEARHAAVRARAELLATYRAANITWDDLYTMGLSVAPVVDGDRIASAKAYADREMCEVYAAAADHDMREAYANA
jgi:hypothetical protein